jgi:thiamine-monophosphate kinase
MPSGEERIIDLFRPMARHPAALGLVDDCAALTPPPGHDLVLKADAIVGTVHFFADDPAADVARKALRVNLSDLAAKGATPVGFLLSLALPTDVADGWLTEFARGLGEDAETYACPLFGGDTVSTPGPVVVSITVLGSVPSGRMVRRDAARDGDHIVVTGTIGDAVLGLRLRQDEAAASRWGLDAAQAAHLVGRYRRPQPRNAIAAAILQHARAGMDISDGLVGDLGKMCAAAGVAATVEAAAVPLSEAARAALAADPALITPVLTGGDDYEILATVGEAELAALRAAAQAAGVAVTPIGRIVTGEGLRVLDVDNKVMAFRQGSYSHF